MTTFDLAPALSSLISKAPEQFPYERAIRLLQFKTWIYFPEEYDVVDAAGRLAAAAFLRRHEKEAIEAQGMGRQRMVNSRALRRLLQDKTYASLYDALFEENGWTQLATTETPVMFDKLVSNRQKNVHTICEMVDFRFRALDHKTLPSKEANISRSEVYVWSSTDLSSKLIRERWSMNRSSAPFLYASEKLGFNFVPPPLGSRFPASLLVREASARHQISKFIATSLYVADKLDVNVFEEYDGMAGLKTRHRPTTTPLSERELDQVKQYKEKLAEMRAGTRREAGRFQ